MNASFKFGANFVSMVTNAYAMYSFTIFILTSGMIDMYI